MVETKITPFLHELGEVKVHSTSEPQDGIYFASVTMKLGYYTDGTTEEMAVEKIREFLRTHKPAWVPKT